jgi:integrase
MNKEPIKLAEAAKLLGIDPDTLKKRCQRGMPGAVKVQDGKAMVWAILPDALEREVGGSSEDEYLKLHAEWLDALARGNGYKKQISPRGVEAYVYGMEKFWLFLENPPTVIKKGYKKGEEHPKPTRKANLRDLNLENLNIAIINVPIDRESLNCHYSLKDKIYKGYRSFLKFLINKGLRSREEWLGLDDVRPVRVYEEKRPVLTENALSKLIETNDNLLSGRRKDRQDYDIQLTKLIIYLAAFAGLRREDIYRLQMVHIDLNRQELSIIDGKGNKNRDVGFNEDLRDLIASWIAFHRPKSKFNNLLVRENGLPLSEDMVYKRIRRVAKQAGLDINPHGLRRTCASIALEYGVSIHHIAENFGHTETATTERSYVKVSQRQAVNAFKAFRPELASSKAKKQAQNHKLKQLSSFTAIEQF